MAVVRYAETDDNTVNYIATLASFCCVTCVIAMFKFGRSKTSFNVYSEKKRKSGKTQNDIGNLMSINGAYRTNRDELFIYNNYSEPQRKLTPSVPVPPPIPFDSKPDSIKQSKSTSDLIKNKNLPQSLHETQSGVSQDPRGAEHENGSSRNQDSKNYKQLDAEKRVAKQKIEDQKKLEKQRLEEKKKLEKQRIEEEKKRERLAMQERAKQEKLKKEREKEQLKKEKKTKNMAPQKPLANPLTQSNNKATNNTSEPLSGQKYSTNTLDSSISKSSGPPPYSAETERSENANNSNVIFRKPEDTGSWDLISQHRHNVCIKRPLKADAPMKGKSTTLDLNFTLGEQTNRNNNEVEM